MPVWLALSVVLGVVIGTFYANHIAGGRTSVRDAGGYLRINTAPGLKKMNSLLELLDDQYVDTVNMVDVVEKAIPQILSELDPHSVYLTAKEAQTANDDLRGSFSGVGIEFIIRNDTLRVQNVIADGPAEDAGLLAGDKIVMVDDSVFTGKELTNELAMSRLKGPSGTKVKLGVLRYGEKEQREFTVTRGEIPMTSVAAVYMLNDDTGYMKIKNFGENTYREMLVALARLSMDGFQQLVIDLRGNTGGYLEAAQKIANEFLPRNRIIVYTEGRRSPKMVYASDGHGTYQRMPLVVLIDEGSASASEILAGAIQDNDRGTIIGRRSFGKGLVQQPVEFNDGSVMRLTVARYYSPSGRCIQKPYASGQDKDYEEDLMQRYQHGEFFTVDSIKHTGPEYHTVMGRTVYGGGGITPDIFVPEDTSDYTSYYKEAAMTGLILQFAYDYTDDNRKTLSQFTTQYDLVHFLKKKHLVEQFAQYAEKRGLKRRNLMIKRSYHLLEEYIMSRMVYNLLDEDAWVEYLNQDDPTIKEALRVFKQGLAFPQPPTKEAGQQVALSKGKAPRLTAHRYLA
jgi:carboxyl-terminal processing protease